MEVDFVRPGATQSSVIMFRRGDNGLLASARIYG
jgi:hypothetical protein